MTLVQVGSVPLGRVGVGPHPNGLAYDDRRRRLWVFNLGEPLGEDCTVSVVDLETMTVAAELPLPGRPRWAVFDPGRDVVYANIARPAQIPVIDAGDAVIAEAFDVPGEGPHGLWLERGLLFCAADGGAMVVLDAAAGGVKASLPLPGVPDVVMHDGSLRRLYVAIGDPGVVCSFDTATFEARETVVTEQGAHTTAWDPVGRRLYVFRPVSSTAAVFEERD